MSSPFRPITKADCHSTSQHLWPKNYGCGFCKRNGEMPSKYLNHQLKDGNGRVTCPRLRAHVCELCGATGDEAHTRSYCDWARMARGDPFFKELFAPTEGKSITFQNMVVLKRTRVNSAGMVRRRR